jgi:hypothetical protein
MIFPAKESSIRRDDWLISLPVDQNKIKLINQSTLSGNNIRIQYFVNHQILIDVFQFNIQ